MKGRPVEVAKSAPSSSASMRAVGPRLECEVKMGESTVRGLVDTGSQVTIVSEGLYRRYLQQPSCLAFQFRLTAANGSAIPTIGCFVTDIVHQEQRVPGVVVVIVPDTPGQPDCILGTNFLSHLSQFPVPLAPLPRTRCGRTPGRDTLVPANSLKIVTLFAGARGQSGSVVVEPTVNVAVDGLALIRSFSNLQDGRVEVAVINPTDEDLWLPAKTTVALVSSAKKNPQVNVVSQTDEPKTELGGVKDAADERAEMRVGDPGKNPAGSSGSSKELDWKRVTINPELEPTQVSKLRHLLEENEDLFAWTDRDLGYTNLIEHEIHLTEEHPIAQPYRRLPPAVLSEVKLHIQDLLDRDVIAPSSSPFSSPIVVVRKKTGELRLCVDYRRLNRATRRDSFPLPRIDESLDALGGAKFFSSLDLASGYYQVKMADEDRAKTAFVCPFGLYEFKRMPFGLTNAPATFQRLMNGSMSDFIFGILLVYLDDLLVYESDFDRHLQALEKVFGRIRSIGVRLNPDKCRLAMERVGFLGHVVSGQGIETDPEKVSSVKDWPTPNTTRQVRSFLGLASYYRRFIEGFSKIARPLNALYKQVHELHPNDRCKGERKPLADLWTAECEFAFQTLKKRLIEAPVLGHPDFTLPFILEVDASHEGLGAILSQKQGDKLVVIAYASRTLRLSEQTMRNYSSRKLELLGLKWAIADKFRGYLLGHEFDAYTDNNALAHLESTNLSAVETRWVGEIAAVGSMRTHFRPGTRNRNADALSRNPTNLPEGPEEDFVDVAGVSATRPRPVVVDTELPPTLRSNPKPLPLYLLRPSSQGVRLDSDMEKQQKADPTLRQVVVALKNGRLAKESSALEKQLWKHHRRLQLMDGVLVRQYTPPGDTREVLQVVVPKDLRERVLKLAHEEHGHQGQERCHQFLRQRCFWPTITADTEKHVANCTRCLMAKKAPRKLHVKQGHLRATQPLEIVALDFLKLDRAANGMEDVLVLTDVFTKYSLAFATRDQTAHNIAKVLVERWFPYFGVPRRIHSDQGRNFESKLVKELLEMHGIRKSRTTPYHPAGNGQCERFNQTLISMLRCLDPPRKPHWPEFLATTCFAYNATPHSAHGHAPFTLLFGREPHTKLDAFLDRKIPPQTAGEDYLEQHRRRLRELHRVAQDRMEKRDRKTDSKQAEGGAQLRVGDRVLRRQFPMGRCKLADKYGPDQAVVCRLPQAEGPGAFRLRRKDGTIRMEHGSNLRKLPESAHLPAAPCRMGQPKAPLVKRPREVDRLPDLFTLHPLQEWARAPSNPNPPPIPTSLPPTPSSRPLQLGSPPNNNLSLPATDAAPPLTFSRMPKPPTPPSSHPRPTPQLGTPQLGTPQLGTPQLGTPQLGTPQLGTP